jgi:hypothetical protein
MFSFACACLAKHYDIKMYGEVGVYTSVFLTSALVGGM